MRARGSGEIPSAVARARRRRSAAAVCPRDSNTSALLPGCLPGNKLWRGTRASTRLADSIAELHADCFSRLENPFVCTRFRPAPPGTSNHSALSELQLQTPVLPRSIFPGATRPIPPRSRDRAIDPPDLVRGAGLHPSALHQRRSVLQQGGPAGENDPVRRLTNPASIQQAEQVSHGLFGESQQHPIAVRSPFLLEFRAFDSEKFATRGVVDENGPISPIDSRAHNVVQRRLGAPRLEAYNERPSLRQVFPEIFPFTLKRKNAKARTFEVAFDIGSINPPGFARIEQLLNCHRVGPPRFDPRAVGIPILQNHGDHSGPTAILTLLYERHVKPHSWIFLGRRLDRTPQEEKHEQTKSNPVHPREVQLRIERISGARPQGQ